MGHLNMAVEFPVSRCVTQLRTQSLLQTGRLGLKVSLCVFVTPPEQCEDGGLPCQPLLLALCGGRHLGYHVHSLRPLHGTHRQDPREPTNQVKALMTVGTSLY